MCCIGLIGDIWYYYKVIVCDGIMNFVCFGYCDCWVCMNDLECFNFFIGNGVEYVDGF